MSDERDFLRGRSTALAPLAALALLGAVASGCGDDPAPAPTDAGGVPDVARDAQPDAGDDAAPDAGDDAGDDAAPDASPDARVDATPDARADATPDATPDVAPDVAPDVPPDTMPAGMIRVRVAHLSPDAPAVDVCVRPAGAPSWSGLRPTLAGLGVTAGLAYPQVTTYLTLSPGAYEVRIVAPGSANCDTALAGLPDTTLPALPDGARATVGAVGLLSGMGDTAFRLQPYVDEAPATPSQIKVRFVHASPGTPAVDVGIPGMGTMFTSVFGNVAFPNGATPYFTSTTALAGASLAARVAGMATAAGQYPVQVDGVNVPLGTTVSTFAIGRIGNTTTPLRVLVCNDGATAMGAPALTACNVLGVNPAPTPPAQINVRVAHLSPGAPAVDVCVRPASATSWAGVRPTLASLGVAAGLAYAQVTRYLALDAGAYTVRIVAPGSANCDAALAGLPDTNLPALPGGARATVGAVGVVGDTGATAFRLQPYVDETPAGMGEIKVRFVHASPGTPAVDVGIPGTGTMFTSVFGNVAFPNGATPYFTSTTALAGASLAARVAGMATAAGQYPVQVDGVNVPLGTTVSTFAIGRIGNATTPLRVLVCNDGATAMGSPNLGACSVLGVNPAPTPPAQINVRVAHLSPGAPAVDFCVRPSSATSWAGVRPTLGSLGGAPSISYLQMTRYLALDAGAYTARLVAPGSANCDASLAGLPDYPLPALAGGTRATVAAVGVVGDTGATAFRLQPYVDEALATSSQLKVRFVHASPGTPAVDVGIPGAGTEFTTVFGNVAFPAAATPYFTSPAPLNATLAVRVAGAPTAADLYPLTLPGVSLPLGSTSSVFAVGRLGNAATPLGALICNDTTPLSNNLSICALLPSRGPQVNVRVAHLSPDAPPVDFCLRAAGAAAFTGPVLGSLGVAGGLAYGQVTRYLPLDAAAYTVRLVAPGSADCATALGGLPDTALPALTGGVRATVGALGLLSGSGATAFRLAPFVDDATPAPAAQARVRFVHASPGTPNVDVGVPGAGTAFTTVFGDVAYGAAAAAINVAPLAGATLAARPAGAATAAYPLTLRGVNLPAGSRTTVFAVGALNDDQTPLAALVCDENAPAAGALTPCVGLPPRISVRIAHLSPNAPAVDVCVRAASGTFAGAAPVLRSLGVAAGLSFAQVTRYLALDPGQYVARIVAPNSPTCDAALAGLPDVTLPALAAGARATVAATGRLGDTGATAFAIRPIVDGDTRPALGRIHLRFGHFAPTAPNVDVGVLAGATFTPVFANVPFGSLASPTGAEAGTGYLPLAPLSAATLQVRVAGSATVALTVPNVSIPATVSRGTAVSIFAIGVPGAAGDQRLSALVCNDRVPAAGAVAACARLP
ncbi:MAG: DUF4397 domain-containing protein [Polyangiales bacterium]